jgi:thiol-disulfide isomerase/thioredoxin
MSEHWVTARKATTNSSSAGGISRRRFYLIPVAGFTVLALVLAWGMTRDPTTIPSAVPEKNFVVHASPQPIPTIKFDDNQGQSRSLADFKGKTVVLNIWATWCVPCRREMPALDRLQAALGGPEFAVVPVSIDRGGLDTVSKLYAEIGIRDLPKYSDTSGQIVRALSTVGLPTTLILNRAGQEIGRVIGPAEWDTPEIAAFLKAIISRKIDHMEGVQRSDDDRRMVGSQVADPFTRAFRWLKTLVVN